MLHDVCSAIHPLALGSPAFREIAASDTPLEAHGLEWIHSDVPVAHPLDGGRAAVLHRSVDDTADGLGADAKAYRRLFGPFVEAGFDLTDGLLSPLSIPPKHPITLARYGAVGILPAHTVARRGFDTDEARALFAGPRRSLDPEPEGAGDCGLRPDARRARPSRRVAAREGWIATDRQRARGRPGGPRRSGRMRPAHHLAEGTPACRCGAARPHATSGPRDCR